VKKQSNFEHIKKELALNANTFTEPMVLDGEVMSSSFQDLMKQVHRKDNVAAGDAVLWLFDILPLRAFKSGIFDMTQKDRSVWLHNWYNNQLYKSMSYVRCLDQAIVDLDTEQGQNLFRMYNKSAIENKYEGIMIKDPDAAYECKRSTAWLKLKPFIEVSLAVVDLEEGTGRNAGRLGAIIFPIATVIVFGKEVVSCLDKWLKFVPMLLLKIKMALTRYGFRVSYALEDLQQAKKCKGFVMDKQAIKELMYGGLKEIMNNNRYYYKSSVGKEYSSFTPNGKEVVQEFVTDLAGYIIAAENAELDQRAKDLVMKELKGN